MSCRRSTLGLAAIGTLAFMMFAGLMALGLWQLERRVWKHALIAQVDARIHATAVAAPGPSEWRWITADRDAYRRVSISGHFLNNRETYVQAATVRGSGYWVLTPMRTDSGFVVLINRGFVPPERRNLHGRVEGPTKVTGLLRITEPDGGFLRRNNPAGDRWYSRDVAAIARARKLSNVAPYFVDADADAVRQENAPVAGLTVLSFRDHHLAYALTWFTLALMILGGAAYFAREEWRGRRTDSAAP